MGDCDALGATQNALKRVRFAATGLSATDSCKSDGIETIGVDSTPDAVEAVEDVDDVSTIIPTIAKLRKAARMSKLIRYRTGRQHNRRALQAQTEVDFRLLSRFESEMISARAHRARHEQQLLQACALGNNTTVDMLTDVIATPAIYRPAHLDGTRGSV